MRHKLTLKIKSSSFAVSLRIQPTGLCFLHFAMIQTMHISVFK